MIKTVVFGMDGLMFDTERLNNEAWNFAANKLGVTISKEMLDSIKGFSNFKCDKMLASWLGDKVDVAYLRKVKTDYVDKYLAENGVPVKKGLKPLLSYLKTHGYRTVLATSTTEDWAMKILKLADVEKYFDHLIFANMIEKSKPDPEIFQLASKKSYTAPGECLVLEDSPNGVKAAHAAGCHVIMVPDVVEPSEDVKAMADAVEESLEEVLEMVKPWSMTA